jgi:hypothetical protein
MRALILLLSLCTALVAAEYKGTWRSAYSEGSGEIRLSLQPESNVVFTFGGTEVKAKLARASVEGSAVELEFHFTIDGNDLKSVYKATKSDRKLSGKYVTSTRSNGEPVDGGSIEVTESE